MIKLIDKILNIIKLLQSIRKNGLNRDSCIIFVSANVEIDAYDECMKSGGNDYIAKPVSIEVLSEKLSKYIDLGEQTGKG